MPRSCATGEALDILDDDDDDEASDKPDDWNRGYLGCHMMSWRVTMTPSCHIIARAGVEISSPQTTSLGGHFERKHVSHSNVDTGHQQSDPAWWIEPAPVCEVVACEVSPAQAIEKVETKVDTGRFSFQFYWSLIFCCTQHGDFGG